MKYLSILLFLGIYQFANSQVHLKKQTFYELSAGGYDNSFLAKSNFSLQIGIGKYNRKGNAHVLGLNYNQKTASVFNTQNNNTLPIQIPVQQFYFSYKTDFRIYSNAMNDFHLRGIGRVNFGYESLNHEKQSLENLYQLNQKSDFLLGVGAGLEVEYSPFVAGVHQNINILSNYQKFSSITFLGFRFHIN